MSPGSGPSVPCWDHERAAQWSEMHAHLASEEKTPERSARQRGARRELYGQRRAEDAKNAGCQKSETVLCYPPCHFHLSLTVERCPPLSLPLETPYLLGFFLV